MLSAANTNLRIRALTRILQKMCLDVTEFRGMCPKCMCFDSFDYSDGAFLCGNYCEFTFLDDIADDLPKLTEHLHACFANNTDCDDSHAQLREHIDISLELYRTKWWPQIVVLYDLAC